jgi:hypothetical protein
MTDKDCICEGSCELPVDGCPKHDPIRKVIFIQVEKDDSGW